MKTRALIVAEPERMVCGEADVPEPGAGEVLVEAAYSCVSPGTELRCMSGKGEATRFPYVPGYAMAGKVVACGPGTSLKEGARVFSGGTSRCDVATQWGAHIAYAVRPEAQVVPVPENVGLLEAAVARIAAISHHAVRFSQPREGKNIAVVGLGPVGQFSARIHHALGARVVGGDLVEARVKLLAARGVEAVSTAGGLGAAFAKAFPDGADVVVDATGAPGLIPQLIGIARDKPWDDQPGEGARYIVQGSYAGDVHLPYIPAFMKELSFYLPRDAQLSDIRSVLALMSEGKLPARDVVTEIHDPENAQEAFDRLRDAGAIPGTVAFAWKPE